MSVCRKRRRFPFTAQARSAARDGTAWLEHWGSATAARHAYRECHAYIVRPGHWPLGCYWEMEPGLPKALRRAPVPPDPRAILGGEVLPTGFAEAVAAVRAHHEARREWLRRVGILE